MLAFMAYKIPYWKYTNIPTRETKSHLSMSIAIDVDLLKYGDLLEASYKNNFPSIDIIEAAAKSC